ncbi:MAG: HD domain-containing protein [Treponema sp.]|nr:HD domain-containing protein [Treponema sp.]MBQ4235921.1 HD domain-containing protein [Treponema sp.]MBQ5384917.1 HD domain-containing protein [Treponema sp.]
MKTFDKHHLTLKKMTQIERRLSEIKDEDLLLENILISACDIVNADAGSIYSYHESKNTLKIKYSVNKTQQAKLAKGEKLPYLAFAFPVDSDTICGYCALSKKTINIPDVYNMSEYEDEAMTVKRPYKFSPTTDMLSGYHTTSMLTIPLMMTNGKILGVLQIINARDSKGNDIPFDEAAEFYISHFATNVGQIYEYAYLTKQTISRLVRTAGFRDPKETGAHVERVSNFAVEIYDKYAVKHDIPERERYRYRNALKLAAKCHDVGKVAIPDQILKKNGPLTDEERNIMKAHTILGAQLFTPPESDVDRMAIDVCLNHHQFYNGDPKGYPGKLDDYMALKPGDPAPSIINPLKGEEIPLSARIVSLADVYDALRHMRSYKKEWTLEDTVNEIKSQSGKQFDPELVDIFIKILDRLEAINKAIS